MPVFTTVSAFPSAPAVYSEVGEGDFIRGFTEMNVSFRLSGDQTAHWKWMPSASGEAITSRFSVRSAFIV